MPGSSRGAAASGPSPCPSSSTQPTTWTGSSPRAEEHGGKISKQPKNALWGYSAYVTDPDGYLWKVASSKRRPLLGRGESVVANGRPSAAQAVPITIGVGDMKRAKDFYEAGVRLPVKKDYRKFVMFSGEGRTSELGMYKREALADDAAVQAEGSGFHGFSITHVVDSPRAWTRCWPGRAGRRQHRLPCARHR